MVLISLRKLAFVGFFLAASASPIPTDQPSLNPASDPLFNVAQEYSFRQEAGQLAATLAAIDSMDNKKVSVKIHEILSAADEKVSSKVIASNVKKSPLEPGFDMLGSIGEVLTHTTKNLLSINLAPDDPSNGLALLLTNVNEFLLALEKSVKPLKITEGLGKSLQLLLINSGLQSLVLGLTTVVSTLVSLIIDNATIDTSVKTQIMKLSSHIEALDNAFKGIGASGNSLDSLGSQLRMALGTKLTVPTLESADELLLSIDTKQQEGPPQE